MSIVIDTPAALVASPRPCAPAGTRLHADDAEPRLRDRSAMPAAVLAWRDLTGSGWGYETAAAELFTSVITFDKQHSTRSGPPPSRPPA